MTPHPRQELGIGGSGIDRRRPARREPGSEDAAAIDAVIGRDIVNQRSEAGRLASATLV